MRLDQYVVLLDACVLAPMPVCDTLLRLAEEPAFYAPKWSWEILEEVSRTLVMAPELQVGPTLIRGARPRSRLRGESTRRLTSFRQLCRTIANR